MWNKLLGKVNNIWNEEKGHFQTMDCTKNQSQVIKILREIRGSPGIY